jgi:membrane-bound ClpP family serine protease
MAKMKSRVFYSVWAMAWFLACVLSPLPSQAANIVLDAAQSDLRIEGPIEPGDAERFRREFRGKARLVLNSPGGSMNETLKIIELMEKHAPDNEVVGTYLPRNSICFSACAFIFMHGGGVRAMDYTASLGFHAPWLPKTSPDDHSYTWSDLAGAFTEGQRVIRELAQYNRMSLDLFVELLGKGPNELYMIDTPYRAAKLGHQFIWILR